MGHGNYRRSEIDGPGVKDARILWLRFPCQGKWFPTLSTKRSRQDGARELSPIGDGWSGREGRGVFVAPVPVSGKVVSHPVDKKKSTGWGTVYPTLATKIRRGGSRGWGTRGPGFVLSHPVDRKKSTGWGTDRICASRALDARAARAETASFLRQPRPSCADRALAASAARFTRRVFQTLLFEFCAAIQAVRLRGGGT
jgi:hypothetical protein